MHDYLASETTDLISAWATVGGAVITAASVAVAAWFGIRTLREAESDSRDRSRPMVGALLERDAHPTGTAAYLVVRNYGPSVAYNVEVRFAPEIEASGTRSGEQSLVPMLLRRYAHAIPNLMPGVELRNVWNLPSDEWDSEGGHFLNDEPIPDRVTASITYTDAPDATRSTSHTYVDTFVLDINVLRGDVIVTHTDDHLGLHKRSTKALEKIRDGVTGLNRSTAKLEQYAKPDSVRIEERAQAERSRRNHQHLVERLTGDRGQASADPQDDGNTDTDHE